MTYENIKLTLLRFFILPFVFGLFLLFFNFPAMFALSYKAARSRGLIAPISPFMFRLFLLFFNFSAMTALPYKVARFRGLIDPISPLGSTDFISLFSPHFLHVLTSSHFVVERSQYQSCLNPSLCCIPQRIQ